MVVRLSLTLQSTLTEMKTTLCWLGEATHYLLMATWPEFKTSPQSAYDTKEHCLLVMRILRINTVLMK